MAKTKKSNLIFTDDEHARMLMSDNFNFALDKDSGVSACWGKTINDSPEYDPVGPQELIFKIDEKFNLETYLTQFIFLANIKVKKDKTEFESINNVLQSLSQENLTVLSTVASVVLIFDNTLMTLKLNDILQFKNFITKFKIPVIIQLNINDVISDELLTKLKLLGTSIQLKTDDNFINFPANINFLHENNFIISSKFIVTKENYKVAKDFCQNYLCAIVNKDEAIKVYFLKPFVTVTQYKEIQNAFLENKFENCRIATCNNKHFNSKAPNMLMLPMDCDASRFSIYIENNTIYPCEFCKNVYFNLDTCKSITDFWQTKDMQKFRKKIINNNYC